MLKFLKLAAMKNSVHLSQTPHFKCSIVTCDWWLLCKAGWMGLEETTPELSIDEWTRVNTKAGKAFQAEGSACRRTDSE